jgi:hypothetical protein
VLCLCGILGNHSLAVLGKEGWDWDWRWGIILVPFIFGLCVFIKLNIIDRVNK